MNLWTVWFSHMQELRPAFSRFSSFMWAVISTMGMSVRDDALGVTSFVRALGLSEKAYGCLLRNFHSQAVDLHKLQELWIKLVVKLFKTSVLKSYMVAVLDGLKIPKEGLKMPGVKLLHQESNNNSKPEWIYGHSLQTIALLVKGVSGQPAAIPLLSEIHEGVVESSLHKESLMVKALKSSMKIASATDQKFLMVADAYYANSTFLKGILGQGGHVVTRVRHNAVGYYPVDTHAPCKPGRPKKYGEKVNLNDFFKEQVGEFKTINSQIYGEGGSVTLSYLEVKLMWRPLGGLVRFILVNHSKRGKCIFLTTDFDLNPEKIIELYGMRQKIEVSFKHAIHVIGAYCYRFWMKGMKPRKDKSGDQYLHRETAEYRQAVKRKMKAYAVHITLGCIAQGMMQYFSMHFPTQIWSGFGSWFRTMRTDKAPSELVVSSALKIQLFDFLAGMPDDHALRKFLLKKMDLTLARARRLVA